jgi:hypothetical protein
MANPSSCIEVATGEIRQPRDLTIQALRSEFPQDAALDPESLIEKRRGRATELMRHYAEIQRYRACLAEH